MQGCFFVVSRILNCRFEHSQLIAPDFLKPMFSADSKSYGYMTYFYRANKITITGNTLTTTTTIILHDDDPSVPPPSLSHYHDHPISLTGIRRSPRPRLNGPPHGYKCATSNTFTCRWMSLAFPEAQKTSNVTDKFHHHYLS